jgi:pyruvate dehydrogenase E2 component (dihydrolipoamide acetyltransferase)
VREHGLSLDDLTGTGPGGRIVRDDVRRAVAERAERAAPPAPVGPQRTPAGYEDVPHTRMRRAIATRLAESNREAPHFYVRGTARVDDLLAVRARLNAGDGPRITVNDLVVAAVARTHAGLPEMNVVWTPDAVRRYATVDVGVAVATDRGLVTPVVRGVESRTVSSIARATADLTERARAGALRQDELEGGTITVSNLGGFGTEEFTAVLNPPQAAILAVGAARREAVVDGDELAVGTVLHVTLTVDHRPVDGALAARWMAAFLALLEDPLRILA